MGVYLSYDGVSSNELKQGQSVIWKILSCKQIEDDKNHTSHSEQAKNIHSPMKEAAVQGSGTPVSASLSVKEGSIFSSSHENKFRSPDTSLLPLQSSVEGSSEKVPEDGYNWRKYGRKQVKGNEFIRSYYRCTRPNCPAKRQLERSHDGRITDTTYFGQHDHPKPHSNIPTAVAFDVSIIERRSNVPSTKTGVEHVHTTSRVSQSDYVKGMHSEWTKLLKDKTQKERDLEPKRQKKDNDHATPSPIDESRVVVHTQSEVDIVNDGYRWRKYGQKLVKGNENPRSYYRCSSTGCPAKKHVERASYDAKVVINTYEGQHNHDFPPSRTITHDIGVNINATIHQPESEPQLENIAADLRASENTSEELVGRSDKQVQRETTTSSEVNNAVTHPAKDSGFRSVVQEQQNGKSDTLKEGDSVSIHDKGDTSVPDKDETGSDLQTQTEERKVVSQDIVPKDISDFEKTKDDQEISTADVVHK